MCIYYRESLAVELVESNYLSERLLCKFSINNKKDYVAVLYGTPSQISLELDDFILCFEMMLSDINSSNPQFSIILGDFNARSLSHNFLWFPTINIRTNTHFKEFVFLY